MERRIKQIYFFAILAITILCQAGPARAQNPVVHAILFYSDTCPHCHQVITQDLPPLFEKYGEQLVIIGINTYTEQGSMLYQNAIEHFQIPENRLGVPTLIVGTTVLVGALEIPTQFPVIVERAIDSGQGIDWPDIPGIRDILIAEGLLDTEADPASDPPPADPAGNPNPNAGGSVVEDDPPEAGRDGPGVEYQQTGIAQRFARDLVGNSISVFVLLGMALSLVGVGVSVANREPLTGKWPAWALPVLVAVGLGVAVYMGYVEVTESQAVCGPVGDCNTVQQSVYAYLFGVIPIGVLGVFGFILIGLVWFVSHFGPARWRKLSSLVLWSLALFGTLFSIYLTFLEPFVIGATCAWCLTSAVVMTLILWASTPTLIHALSNQEE